DEEWFERLRSLDAELVISETPAEAVWLPYAGKVLAAARAEEMARGEHEVLAWMDEDTVILQEPKAFALDPEIEFAYRPVMHNRTGSLHGEPPDEIWRRVYERLAISEDSLFPMVTPADGQTIRAYFNAGLLVVRPAAGVLGAWASDFEKLYGDERLAEMCEEHAGLKIFLHQMALVGAVLNRLQPDCLLELPDTYNYPIFFHQQFGSPREFNSIDGVVTLRHDVYFRDPDPDWRSQLAGPPDRVAWLSERLGR
ncbi:MAG: hypothetical protein GY953_48315, partial [bacterium]|nr:hypothetical protein [bacterium]